MGWWSSLFGEVVSYDVAIYYKCKNCDKMILMGTENITLKLGEHDGKAELQDKIIQRLLYPYGTRTCMNGYVIHFGHSANSQYFPIKPHNCEDGRVGISEFAAVNITKAKDTKIRKKE